MKGFDQTAFLNATGGKKLWIFDLDGVVYKGEETIEGAPDLVKLLEDRGLKTTFLTNNSTKTRAMYVETLNSHGIKSSMENIFTSAWITAGRLVSLVKSNGKNPKDMRVYVIGEKGLKNELTEAGFALMDSKDFDEISTYKKVDFVVVGLDRHLTYRKLFIALNALLQGAAFIVTNDDANMPIEGDFIAPGTGSIVKALITASGKKPGQGSPYGKPNPLVYDVIEESTGFTKDTMIMVGDRLETDILSAKRANVASILMLSGITQDKDNITPEYAPDFILSSVKDLIPMLTG